MKGGFKQIHAFAVNVAGVAALVSWAVQAPVLAQVTDPTRPPGIVLAPSGAADVGAGASGLAGGVDSGVQAVFVRPKGAAGKSSALINGQMVEVGGMVGDKRVLKISDSEVVLKGSGGREVMKVIPAIEKIPVKATQNPPAKVRRGKVAATPAEKVTSEK